MTVSQIIRKHPWGTVFGLLMGGVYSIFTLIAISTYPQNVSPFEIYLSALGNTNNNPNGANYYNLAVILAGLIEIPFFITMYLFYFHKDSKWLLRTGLIAGIINGLSIIASGVFSQTVNYDIHIISSYFIFISLVPVLVTFSLFFSRSNELSKYVGYYGFIVVIIDLIFLLFLLSGQIGIGIDSAFEWFSVFSYIVWIVLVSLDILMKSRADSS